MTRLPDNWEALGLQRERESKPGGEVRKLKLYPIHAETAFPHQAPTSLITMTCDGYAKALNSAFYDGFLTAALKDKEEADAVGLVERVWAAATAIEKSAMLCGAPNPKPFEALEKILTEEEKPNDRN